MKLVSCDKQRAIKLLIYLNLEINNNCFIILILKTFDSCLRPLANIICEDKYDYFFIV